MTVLQIKNDVQAKLNMYFFPTSLTGTDLWIIHMQQCFWTFIAYCISEEV